MQLSLRWTSKQDRLTRTTKQVIGVVPSIKEIPMCYLLQLLSRLTTLSKPCACCAALEYPIYLENLTEMRSNLYDAQNGTLACSPKESGLIGFKRRQGRTSESTTRDK